jgi:hypothetical protein
MAGVALVGLSGSLIKSTLTESPLGNILALRARGNDALESVDEPEATTVLVGELPCAIYCDHMWAHQFPFRCLLYPFCSDFVSTRVPHFSLY